MAVARNLIGVCMACHLRDLKWVKFFTKALDGLRRLEFREFSDQRRDGGDFCKGISTDGNCFFRKPYFLFGSSLVAEVLLLVSLPSVFFSFAIITLLPISRTRKRKRLLRKSLEEVLL